MVDEKPRRCGGLALGLMLASSGAQAAAPMPAPAPAPAPAPVVWTTQADHQNMLDQLGIRALRPGPSGDEKAPNHANYDEALANPFPDYPALMRLNAGEEVKNARQWQQRRAEIKAGFDAEVLGKVPAHVPAVRWRVSREDHYALAGVPVVARHLVGGVDNAAFPAIAVEIRLVVVVPEHAPKPVPVLVMFGRYAGSPFGPAPVGAAALVPAKDSRREDLVAGAGALPCWTLPACRLTMARGCAKALSGWSTKASRASPAIGGR